MTQSIDKEQIWMGIFAAIPMVIFSQLNKEFTDSFTNRIILAGLFGGLGGLIGVGTYRILKSKKTFTKSLSLIGLLVFSMGVLILIPKLTKPRLVTCEICGYKAIIIDSTECNVCGNSTWEKEERDSIYNSRDEWIREEQLFWFGIGSEYHKIEFYQPYRWDGYEKDKNWKPSLTEQEIREEFENEKK